MKEQSNSDVKLGRFLSLVLRHDPSAAGVALDEHGWAVVEELARRAGGHIRTLFPTHYHELTGLEGIIPGVHNMNIAIREWNGDIVFLRRLIPGPADRSYGIEVARLAGVPMPVVQRARDILAQLEQSRGKAGVYRVESVLLPGLSKPAPESPVREPELAPPDVPHPLVQALRDVDPDVLTPLAALKLLSEWKMLWGKNDEKTV